MDLIGKLFYNENIIEYQVVGEPFWLRRFNLTLGT
jgi:hypothetical protein